MISSGVLLPNIFVIIILHVQCLSILNYPIFLTKQSQGMAQPWSWELAATLSWEMLSFWVKMVMVPLIYIHLQTNCSWIWLGFVHLFSCVSQCQGCFSYDRDVANCTATLKQTGRSWRSSHEARKICKGDHVLYWCNKGTVPMGWFLDWERTTFFWYLLIRSVKSLSDFWFTAKWLPWSENLICSSLIADFSGHCCLLLCQG